MTTATIEHFDIQYDHGESFEVDTKDNVIRGAKIIQAGPLNDGRPLVVDRETLEQVVAFGNMPNKGMKSRLTHPAPGDGFGRHLGRGSNFRIDGDSVRADISIAKSSFDTPHGNLGGYVLSLAEEDAEVFGVSIAGTLAIDQMCESKEDGLMPIRLESLYAVDVVDEPAATRGGLFSKQEKEPDMATDTVEKVTEEVTPVEAAVEPQPQPTLDKVEANQFIDLFGDQGARWYIEGKDLVECFSLDRARLIERNASLLEQVEQLTQQLEASRKLSGEVDPVEPAVAPIKTPEELEAEAKEQKVQEHVEAAKKQGLNENLARLAASFEKPGQ